jgi:hypothetical protein
MVALLAAALMPRCDYFGVSDESLFTSGPGAWGTALETIGAFPMCEDEPTQRVGARP